ncbi:DUF4134 family protein [Tenacibaculum ovolyticum]|uniref:DUF4134 family protein n=1 Tax=Tenacibaculum ovolyticum TaxID=104270 RepID=UPI0007ECC8B3|nr:DUF4134 family protein [Tenacibaculum ovolyticum]
MNITYKRKLLLLLLGVTFFNSYSQSGAGTRITQGINTATAEATSWVDPFTNFLWVLASIVAIAGSYKVFQKYQAQDNDTLKAGMTWAGGFIFIIIANIIIKAVFLS